LVKKIIDFQIFYKNLCQKNRRFSDNFLFRNNKMNLENILLIIVLVIIFGLTLYYLVFPKNKILRSNYENYKSNISKKQNDRISEHLKKIEETESIIQKPQINNQPQIQQYNISELSNTKSTINQWFSDTNDDILTKKTKLEEYRELYELYFKGIPEKYTKEGEKIPGVEPNAEKAITNLENIIKESTVINSQNYREPGSLNNDDNEQVDEDILNLAKIYHLGMHKFEPDLESAEKVYSYLLQFSKTNEGLQEAQNGLSEINKTRTHRWLNLDLEEPSRLGNNYNNPANNPANNPVNILVTEHELVDDIEDILNARFRINPNGENLGFLGNQVPGTRNLTIVDDDVFNMNVILLAEANRNLARQHGLDQAENGNPTRTRRGTQGYNDPQNVHDSQVNSTVKHSIDNLKKSTDIIKSKQQSIKEIRELLGKEKQTDKIKNAFKSLKKIEDSSDEMLGTGMTGSDAINLVWNRIHDSKNKDSSEILKENLLDELSDMQEHGHTVCAGGRFNRIIDTLNVIDPEVKIMPAHAVNKEMMTKSAKIRTDMLDLKDDIDKKRLEMGVHKDQDIFDKELKDNIMDTLKKDYVDTKILTEKKFKSEIGKWIEHI
jgi:hypothetical protein